MMSTDQKYTLGFALTLAIIGFIASAAAYGRTIGLDNEVSAMATRIAETEGRLTEEESSLAVARSRVAEIEAQLRGLNQFISDAQAEIAVLRAEMDRMNGHQPTACLTELWRVAPCERPAPTPTASSEPVGDMPLCYSVFALKDWPTYCQWPPRDPRILDAMLWCMRLAPDYVEVCMGTWTFE